MSLLNDQSQNHKIQNSYYNLYSQNNYDDNEKLVPDISAVASPSSSSSSIPKSTAFIQNEKTSPDDQSIDCLETTRPAGVPSFNEMRRRLGKKPPLGAAGGAVTSTVPPEIISKKGNNGNNNGELFDVEQERKNRVEQEQQNNDEELQEQEQQQEQPLPRHRNFSSSNSSQNNTSSNNNCIDYNNPSDLVLRSFYSTQRYPYYKELSFYQPSQIPYMLVICTPFIDLPILIDLLLL